MTEMWDIARYVEDHPDDYEQRWRLAKKLYMAWEYRLALEHLQVLRNEWSNRVNVVRYLAATYYRLGRYEEASAELNAGIVEWPHEISLREQLARVLEIAGDRENAAKVWEDIADMDPQHPIASTAAKRLKERPEESAPGDLRLEDSDSGIDLSPGTVCPNCGAQNSSEFDRCWQCHAQLFTPRGRSNTPRPAPRAQGLSPGLGLSPDTHALLIGVAAIAFGALALFLTLRLFLAPPGDTVAGSLAEIYATQLTQTRVLAGLGLVAFWIGGLWAGLYLVRGPEDPSPLLVNLSGLLLAALTFVASWLPGWLWYLVLLLPALCAFALLLISLQLKPLRMLGVWAVTQLIVTCGLSATVLLSERAKLGELFNPFTELPAIIAHAAAADEEAGEYLLAQGTIPYERTVSWRSTGSRWLDLRAGAVRFSVYLESSVNGLHFELKDASGTLLYEPIKDSPWSIEFPVTPGHGYEIVVAAPHGGEGIARVGIKSLLRVE